ncbi:CAT RNA binding domain-containing protein, partial [Bacillus sp. WP8]|uniref:CAT RNA binding domain-containing protein n=1 Tax=Bacillus sp. WP8 TaxID=756828 RepID=UPI0016426A7C
IIKVLNTSVVVGKRDEGKEMMVMGKGIGFKNKGGSVIEECDIEKMYVLEDESTCNDLGEVMRETAEEFLMMRDEIISYGKGGLCREVNEDVYICLR